MAKKYLASLPAGTTDPEVNDVIQLLKALGIDCSTQQGLDKGYYTFLKAMKKD